MKLEQTALNEVKGYWERKEITSLLIGCLNLANKLEAGNLMAGMIRLSIMVGGGINNLGLMNSGRRDS